MDKPDETTSKYFKTNLFILCHSNMKLILLYYHNIFQHYVKYIYLGEQLPMYQTHNQSLMLVIHRKLNNQMTLWFLKPLNKLMANMETMETDAQLKTPKCSQDQTGI